MVVPILLLMLSLAGGYAVLIFPGLGDFLLLAAACVLVSLFLLLAAFLRARSHAAKSKRRWIFVDGSNVMHWKGGTAEIKTVREVVDCLNDMGYLPGVVFDANAGYKLSGRYQHDGALGRQLGLPRSRVFVVPKGVPADPMLLAAARDVNARIVTNDRFRDWAQAHPEVTEPGYLVRGGYQAGKLWLDLADAPLDA